MQTFILFEYNLSSLQKKGSIPNESLLPSLHVENVVISATLPNSDSFQENLRSFIKLTMYYLHKEIRRSAAYASTLFTQ